MERIEFRSKTDSYPIHFRSVVFRDSKPTVRGEPSDSPLELTESRQEVRLKEETLARLRGASFALYRGGSLQESTTAGHVSVILSLIFLPTMGFLSIKYWHQTPVGKRISPPNPVVTAADTGDWEAKLSPYIGKVGRSLSQLRPVGTCEFDGERLECIAEMGVIDRDQRVKAIAVRGRNLSVAPADDTPATA